MPNPFFYGGRITNPAQFVGREAELRRIFTALESASRGEAQHISLVGPRRIGKSSLLYHLTQVYQTRLKEPDKYRLACIDLDSPHAHTLPGLLGLILQALDLSDFKRPTLEQFQSELEKLQTRKGVIPVLCLDEFEHLAKRKTEFTEAVFASWRSLGSSSQVVFITASAMPLNELLRFGDLTSNFHNIFTLLPLREFKDSEAHELLLRSDRPFGPVETDELLQLTGAHPAKLQIAASLLYEEKTNGPLNARTWKRLKDEYKLQMDHIYGKKPSFWRQAGGLCWRIASAVPRILGRFVLDLLKNKDASEETAIVLGMVLLILFILICLGIVNPEPWLKFVPTPKP